MAFGMICNKCSLNVNNLHSLVNKLNTCTCTKRTPMYWVLRIIHYKILIIQKQNPAIRENANTFHIVIVNVVSNNLRRAIYNSISVSPMHQISQLTTEMICVIARVRLQLLFCEACFHYHKSAVILVMLWEQQYQITFSVTRDTIFVYSEQ